MDWKRILVGSEPLSTEDKATIPLIEIQGKKLPIHQIKYNLYRGRWIEHNVPRAQLKWESEDVTFGYDWKSIYSIPFTITSSTKLQSLQYRITHRYFPTRRFLCIRGVVEDPYCNKCGDIETIQHYFAECYEIKIFWNDVIERINQKLKPCHRFHDNVNGIIFGSFKTRSVVNLILLVAKQFIASRRFKEERICWDDFVPHLSRYYQMEKIIAIRGENIDKFKDKWTPFISKDLKISV